MYMYAFIEILFNDTSSFLECSVAADGRLYENFSILLGASNENRRPTVYFFFFFFFCFSALNERFDKKKAPFGTH